MPQTITPSMIGVGIISYKRPKHLNLCKDQILKYSHKDIKLSIYIDEPRMGIAYGKNQNLRELRECDYVFLFDSDCFPIKTGWAEYFIEASKASGQHHFQYLKETPTLKRVSSVNEIDIYNNSAGCFMFLTKEVIQKVGGYNPAYGIYGFEHCGYSNGIHKAGLTPLGPYTCPSQAGEYIYSMDLDNHLPFNKQVNHEPSMANEIQNVPTYVAINHKVYQQDTFVYYPL